MKTKERSCIDKVIAIILLSFFIYIFLFLINLLIVGTFFYVQQADELCKKNGYTGFSGYSSNFKTNEKVLFWEYKVIEAECYKKPECKTCVKSEVDKT